jgi:methionine synthase II (cobalamin-independent)
MAQIVGRLVRLGSHVPSDVQLGYHLCYGDAGHKHFKEPEDTSKLGAVANAVSAGLARSIQWIHMPVPRNRTDDAYFAPLSELELHPETELYLGLIHIHDGEVGARARIAAARRATGRFGVATECGMGRRPPETIPELLRIHSAVADPFDE